MRLRGRNAHYINYRHIISWLVRKPGAFEHYRYRDDLFPTSHFRIAYDMLKERSPRRGHKEYLKILHVAALESESGTDEALAYLIDRGEEITASKVYDLIVSGQEQVSAHEVHIEEVDLGVYDELLTGGVK